MCIEIWRENWDKSEVIWNQKSPNLRIFVIVSAQCGVFTNLSDALDTSFPQSCEEKPRRAIDDCKNPAGNDDFLGSTNCANGFGLDRVANGNVSLHCKCRQRQSWRVDSKVLELRKLIAE